MSVSLMKAPERPAFVQFEKRPIEDRDASIREGHIVYRDVDYARITPMGGTLVIDMEAGAFLKDMRDRRDAHAERYQAAYDAWRKGEELPTEGTAIKMWPALSPAEVQKLLAVGVRSIEDLAGFPDNQINKLGPGGMTLKQKAQAWLVSAQDTGKAAEQIAALQAELADQKTMNDGLQAQLRDLAAKVELLSAEPPAGRRGKTAAA